jgi:acid phosphatase
MSTTLHVQSPARFHTILKLIVWFALSAFIAFPNVALADACPATPYLPSTDGSQPANLGILKRQLMDYKCFGAYDREVEAALREARVYVETRAVSEQKLAIVLDIDETALSNWSSIAANDFGFIPRGPCPLAAGEPCGFDAWIALKKATAIRPTLELFNAAKAKGVATFFISARREAQRADTVDNLEAEKYRGWTDLLLQQSAGTLSVQQFKTEMRKKIEDQGFTIIANVGDQFSDLAGGHAERAFKVPNPFYFIP